MTDFYTWLSRRLGGHDIDVILDFFDDLEEIGFALRHDILTYCHDVYLDELEDEQGGAIDHARQQQIHEEAKAHFRDAAEEARKAGL